MSAPTGNNANLHQRLKVTGRRYIRTQEAFQKASGDLGVLAIEAGEQGLKPADIARATNFALTPERIRQIIRDHKKAASEAEVSETPTENSAAT